MARKQINGNLVLAGYEDIFSSIITPIISEPGLARQRSDGDYELIAGNRRKHACELAEIITMPVIIRELDDDGNKARFAALRGTMGNFKCDADGSDKRFGFVLPPNDPNNDTVIIFEVPINCLSHQTMCRQGFMKPVDCWRLSLGGTVLAALTNFLDIHNKVKNCIICTDNDDAGEKL